VSQALLPSFDTAYLEERQVAFSVAHDGGMVCLVIPSFPLPSGYDHRASDLLVRLSPGYPDVPPDMWWFEPPVKLADGSAVRATDVTERYLGRTWQRWSRHFSSGQWRSGVDSLESFLALVRSELIRSAAGG
jgi:hypothetical protein